MSAASPSTLQSEAYETARRNITRVWVPVGKDLPAWATSRRRNFTLAHELTLEFERLERWDNVTYAAAPGKRNKRQTGRISAEALTQERLTIVIPQGSQVNYFDRESATVLFIANVLAGPQRRKGQLTFKHQGGMFCMQFTPYPSSTIGPGLR